AVSSLIAALYRARLLLFILSPKFAMNEIITFLIRWPNSVCHYISKDLDIEEFKKRFDNTRESFINSLKTASKGYRNVRFFACDESGVPIKWVWDDETFTHNWEEGTLEDAIQFARHMINSGMYFAFMGCLSGSSDLDIWLTTFENPIKKPTWPSGKEPKFEIIHEVLTR
ncbi:hypothetical protein, partial [Shewanella oncorhynchi]|uniref:hypothetical protein n=1 Tax=Shewanella oncorhynchi TaxID=2726434 RepID=UPI003D7ABC65